MVTTFSARLLSLANKCNPIVGDRKRARIDGSSIDCDIDKIELDSSSHIIESKIPVNLENASHQKASTATSMDRSYYVARTHPADGPPNKRRRHREELEFAAATVASALADAGRPSSLTSVATGAIAGRRRERALPLGSVNLALARVVTSREFDEELESEDEAGASDCSATSQPVSAMQHRVSMSQNEEKEGEGATKNDNKDRSNDVTSMYMLSGLIQSTRHYYGLAPTNDHDAASTVVASNLKSFPTKQEKTALYTNYAREKQSEENSEGHSSWTPSSSCGDLVDEEHNDIEGKRRKEVDNDNRSDEQSGSEVGDSLTSTSSDSPPPPNDGSNGEEEGRSGSVSERRESLSSIEEPLSIVG